MVLCVFLNKTGNIKVSEIVSELKTPVSHPISVFQLLSGFKIGIVKNAKLPAVVLIYRSVMDGNRNPWPIGKTQKSARIEFEVNPALMIGFRAVMESFN